MAALVSSLSKEGAATTGAVVEPTGAAENAKFVIVPPVPLGKRRSSASRLFLRPLTSNRQNAEAGSAEQQEMWGGRLGLFLSPTGSSQVRVCVCLTTCTAVGTVYLELHDFRRRKGVQRTPVDGH